MPPPLAPPLVSVLFTEFHTAYGIDHSESFWRTLAAQLGDAYTSDVHTLWHCCAASVIVRPLISTSEALKHPMEHITSTRLGLADPAFIDHYRESAETENTLARMQAARAASGGTKRAA